MSNGGKWWRSDAAKAVGITLVAALAFSAYLGISAGADLGAERESISACHDEVRARLKAPSTAEFSTSAARDGDRFEVRGTVDAENGFGADVRAAYMCEVQRSDGASAVLTVDVRG